MGGCHQVTLAAIDKLCEVPQPAEPVIVETTWSEEAKCAPACASSCNTFDDPNDTWRLCEGCKTNLMPDPDADNEGQISQCYPNALGYEMNTRCGNALNDNGGFFCEEKENLSAEMCDMLEYYNCKWMPQTDCPEEKRAQDIADAPTGCCYMAGEGENLFGTDSSFHFDEATEAWDFDSGVFDAPIPEVLCGGGKYADPADTSVFAVDMSCEDVKAGFDTALQAFVDSQADDGATTAAAGRV